MKRRTSLLYLAPAFALLTVVLKGALPSAFLPAAPGTPASVQQDEASRSGLEASEIPPNADRYAVLEFGKRIGIEGVWKNRPNVWRYHYEFNERGHGPWVDETVTINSKGMPVSLDLTGHDELEAATADHYRVSGRYAAWKNTIEHGESDQPGFYLSAPVVHEQIAAVPEELGLLARALLAAPTHKLRILPEGEARIERGVELKVEAHGEQKNVIRYEIAGLDFQPSSIWLEEDGTTFAILGDLSLIRKGWDEAIPALSKAEVEAVQARESALARELSRRPASLAFQHVNLFDSEAGTVRRDVTVVVTGNVIRAVGPAPTTQVPQDAEIVDGRGKMLLPGLWDMHVHLEGNEGLISLSVGVTTVRDVGNNVDDEVEMQRSFDDNTRLGPRMLLAGLLDGNGPYHSTAGMLVGSEEDVRKAIDRYAELGFVQIKIYSSVPPQLVPVIIKTAHAKGMRVSGHIPMHMLAQDAVEEGFDEIHHIYYVFLNFMPDVMQRDAPVGLVAALGDRAVDIRPDSEQVRTFIHLLKDHSTVVDPTLNAFESLLTARPGVPDPTLAAVLERLPVKIRRSALKGGVPVPAGKDQRYRDSFRSCLEMTRALYQAGIRLVVGTDFLAGFTYQRELELHVAAGIPAPAVLQAATLGSSRIMKRDKDLGSITPGKLADMVLVEGDPTSNISDIRHVVLVVKDGVVYSAPALQKAIGVRPWNAPVR